MRYIFEGQTLSQVQKENSEERKCPRGKNSCHKHYTKVEMEKLKQTLAEKDEEIFARQRLSNFALFDSFPLSLCKISFPVSFFVSTVFIARRTFFLFLFSFPFETFTQILARYAKTKRREIFRSHGDTGETTAFTHLL